MNAPLSSAAVRRRQRRALIVAAAEDQLAETGIVGTTLEKVGERVGLSRGALYYYVESREDLLALVLGDVLEKIRADAAARAEGQPDTLHQLECFARAHVHGAVDRPAGRLVVANVDLLATYEKSAELLHQHEVAARALIETAVEQGQLRDLQPVVASTVLFGALNTLCRAYDDGGSLTLDEMIDATLDLTLRSWKAKRERNTQ